MKRKGDALPGVPRFYVEVREKDRLNFVHIEHGPNVWTFGFFMENGDEVCRIHRNGRLLTTYTLTNKRST
jgi:hypothetical protein